MSKDPVNYEYITCPSCRGKRKDPDWLEEEAKAKEYCEEVGEEYEPNGDGECRRCEGTGSIEVDDLFNFFI